VSTVLSPIDGDSIEKAVEDAIKGINDELSDFTVNGDMKEGNINGFATAFFEGTGVAADGGNVNASCAVLTPDGESFFMLMIFELQDLSKRDSADVDKVLASLTKP
jgi:hypothetical protein